jgi:two-component system nitrate/nitrite response regulator NarL
MREESTIRVFLVAPSLVRWGLVRLLSAAAPHIQLLGSASSLEEAAGEIDTQFPDVVIVDANDCSSAALRAVYERARVKIVALVTGGRPHPSVDSAQAWVDTQSSPASFVRTIESTAEGRAFREHAPSPPRATDWRRPAETVNTGVETLTPKQRQVVQAIARYPSAPAKVVADKLHMSEHTLRNHLTEIYSRLGVTGRTHLQALIANQPSVLSSGEPDLRVA